MQITQKLVLFIVRKVASNIHRLPGATDAVAFHFHRLPGRLLTRATDTLSFDLYLYSSPWRASTSDSTEPCLSTAEQRAGTVASLEFQIQQ